MKTGNPTDRANMQADREKLHKFVLHVLNEVQPRKALSLNDKNCQMTENHERIVIYARLYSKGTNAGKYVKIFSARECMRHTDTMTGDNIDHCSTSATWTCEAP
jgi:hypothetical protein